MVPFCVLANRKCQDQESLRWQQEFILVDNREISRPGRGHAWEISAEIGLY